MLGLIILMIAGHVELGHASPIHQPHVCDWVVSNPSHRQLLETQTNITNSVSPIPCHSHNDYSRPMPQFEALRTGCTGVEADVWLSKWDSSDLSVGHSKPSLNSKNTLGSLYLGPIVEMLDQRGMLTFFPLQSPRWC